MWSPWYYICRILDAFDALETVIQPRDSPAYGPMVLNQIFRDISRAVEYGIADGVIDSHLIERVIISV